jgi:hypothetical protein
MKKATHMGQCQCCESTQKLPGGRLSHHGYRVLWSSFVNVCPGTGHLPYEQSCDLIASFIASAESQKAQLVNLQETLRQPATEAIGWKHEYVKFATGKSDYQWRPVEIRISAQYHRLIEYKNAQDRWNRLDLYDRNWETLLDVAGIMNRERAKAIQKDIDGLDRYIAWQQERIAAWKLADLRPVKE